MVDKPKSGRDVDREVAEKVLGYSIYHYDKGYASQCYYSLEDASGDRINWADGERKTEEEVWDKDLPCFSEDIEAAWLIIEYLLEQPNQQIFLVFMREMNLLGWCAPEYLACPRICQAALKAVKEVSA